MNAPSTASSGHVNPGIPLSQLVPGQRARLCPDTLEAGGDGRYLRALGLRPHATVRLCRRGEPCIVDIMTRGGCGCRIGLARPLAERLFVNPLA